MAIKNELSILTKAEQIDLYSPPILAIEEQRLYFTLNDHELTVCKSIRQRPHRCYFIALLGYFKTKPVILDVTFSKMMDDLTYIAINISGGKKLRPFTPSQKQKERLYIKVMKILGYQKWDENLHSTPLMNHLVIIGNAWLEPRYLFDAVIEYLATHKIAIPKYSVLQRLISRTIQQVRKELTSKLRTQLSPDLKAFLDTVIDDNSGLSLSQLRGGAKSVTPAELKKELTVYHLFQQFIGQIDNTVVSLQLSAKNQQHFAEMVDYYGSKLKRFKRPQQHLWLLCFLTQRIQQSLERMADGFIYHIRKQQEASNVFAQQAVFHSWQSAADNVTKAAELLHLFVDDSIDDSQPFASIRQQALKLMNNRDIETLCLYLKKQKRTVEEYQWQYYDEQNGLIEQLLRPIFLCLEYQAAGGSEALVVQLNNTKVQLLSDKKLQTMEASLIPKKHRPWLVTEDKVNSKRYEWLLYRQLTSRLNGRIYLSNVTKYRALEDDLIAPSIQSELLASSTLERLKQPVLELLKEKQTRLNTSLKDVANHIDNGDNRNVIMKSRTGTKWRLPTKGRKSLLNNPFFTQMVPVSIADVLRYVEQETGFMQCFEHVLPIQKQALSNQDDLLAILIANATQRTVVCMGWRKYLIAVTST